MVESPTNLSEEERDALVVRLLEQSEGPLSTTRLWKGLPRAWRGSRAELEGRLAALEKRGRVFGWPQGRFAARPLDAALAEALVAAVSTPLPRSEVVRRVARRVRGAGEKRVLTVLRTLVQERRVFRHPPPFKARTARYGALPPEAADYVEPHLSQLVARLTQKGFAAVDVRAALVRALGAAAPAVSPANGAPDDKQAMLDMIGVLDPQARQGALVYIPHLRNALAHRLRDKLSFDRVVLALAAQRRVQVQAHPVPAQLSPAEREAMVPDGVGGVYMAIGLSAE